MWTYLLYSFTCVTEYVYIACVSCVIHAIRNKNNFLKCPSCFGKGSNYHWTSSHFWIHMGEGTFNIYSYTYYKCWRGKGVGSDCMNYIFQTLWYELFRRVDTICIIKLILGLKYRSVETLATKGYLYVLYTFILWFECIEVTYPAFDLRRGRLIREIRWITVKYFAFIW